MMDPSNIKHGCYRIYIIVMRHQMPVDIVPDYFTGEIDAISDIARTLRLNKDLYGYSPDSQVMVLSAKYNDRQGYNRYITSGEYLLDQKLSINPVFNGFVTYMKTEVTILFDNLFAEVMIKRNDNGKWGLLQSITTFLNSGRYYLPFKLIHENRVIIEQSFSDYDIRQYLSKPIMVQFVDYQ